MEIDKTQLRDLILWLIDRLYATKKELNAHQVARSVLVMSGLDREFDQVLGQARQHPAPALLAEHQKARDTVATLLNEAKFDAALEALRKWDPGGSIQ